MTDRRFITQLSWKVVNTVLFLVLLVFSSQWAIRTTSCSECICVISAVWFYVVLLLTLGWILFITNKWFRNRLFLMSGFAVLFVWGCVSYFCWPVDVEEGAVVEPTVTFQMQSVNRLLACFFSGSLLETAPTPATRLNYELLHFSLIFFLGAWAFSLWGKGAVNRMRRHAILDRHLNVFWGVNKQGIALAKDILANSAIAQVEFNIPSTVFDADEGDAEVRRLDGLDALWMSVDFNRLSRGLTKGAAHYFLSGSGEENMLLADALAKLLPESESGTKKTFYIRIESSADEQMFADWSETLKSRVDIALVREAELIARELMDGYPVLKACPGVSFDPEHVSVSGGSAC